ncbi:hypothetical protein BDV06DRAFT_189283 [Aspergillus oleicola]
MRGVHHVLVSCKQELSVIYLMATTLKYGWELGVSAVFRCNSGRSNLMGAICLGYRNLGIRHQAGYRNRIQASF